MLDGGIINSIIGGASTIAGSLINFGTTAYAINNAQAPVADQNSYNIVLPQQQQSTVFTPDVLLLLGLMFLVLIITAFALYKMA